MNKLKTVLAFLPVLLSGCVVYKSPQPHANSYYLNPNKDLSAIGRTALVELANDSAFPQISSQATEALFLACQKKQLFGLTIVRQNDPAWKSLQLDLNTTYTLEQLSAIRNTGADAVLIGTVTEFKPYPHMTIGLRLKLIDLADGQILWGFEQIWDATDKTTQDRIRKYYSDRNLVGFETLREKLGTVSSLKFVKFAVYETAETLQPKMQHAFIGLSKRQL